jgi:hypothetical protein
MALRKSRLDAFPTAKQNANVVGERRSKANLQIRQTVR